MSKEKQENDHPAALGMIEELGRRYPKTFTHEPHDVRPLARGILKSSGYPRCNHCKQYKVCSGRCLNFALSSPR